MKKSIKDFNLGLALSGGGIRAVVFHAGMLEYLAKINLLESIKVISSVSGGSILIGLIYSLNDGKWPTSYEYLTKVLPKIKNIVCSVSIAKNWYEHLLNPFYWKYLGNRAELLALTLENKWNITGNINELPDSPKWFLTSTVAKNGEKWVFCQDYMGTDSLGYAKTDIKIAEAVAASAAFPGIIGPFQLNTGKYDWYKYKPNECRKNQNSVIKPDNPIYYFSDGGLFDNLGCDSLFTKFGESLIDDIDTIIISNASAPLNTDWFDKWKVLARSKKMIDMLMSHVDQLRISSTYRYLEKNKKAGIFIRIDKHHSDIIPFEKKHLFKNIIFMTEKSLNIVKGMKTHLNKISPQVFDSTFRNGYETALIKSRLYIDHYRDRDKRNF